MYVCPPLIESYIDLVFFFSVLHSLLMASGDQQQVNNAKKELQKPCAVCCRCEQVLLLDEFSHEQWEQIRANIPAFCAACKNGKETTRKRKLNADSLEIYMCTGCSQNQFAAAFPRAQLLQAQAETQRQCLKCLQAQRTEMRSCRCSINKTPREFPSQMVTMPADGIVCLQCQEELHPSTRKLVEDGYFACKTCAKIYPNVIGTSQGQSRRCMNCPARGHRKVGEQTCRKAACKRKWIEEEQPGDGKRPPRYCPDCRQ